MKKQKITIIVLVAIAAVLALLYIFVLDPYLLAEEPEDTEETQPVLDGEVISGGRTLLFPHTEREGIQSIEVCNSNGKYTVYRDDEDNFVLSGFEQLPLDSSTLTSVIVGTGYSITMQRIVDHAEDLTIYGLDDSQDYAWYTLTNTDGESWTVRIGKMLVSNAGYYVCLDGKDSVYAITNTLLDPVLRGKETLVTKQFTSTVSVNDMLNVTRFSIAHGDETYISVRKITDEEKNALGLNINYQLEVPSGYALETATYTGAIEKFTQFAVSEVCAIGITNSKLEKYGLADPAYTVFFEINGEENTIIIGEKNDDGTYYMACLEADAIGKLTEDQLSFLEDDIKHWVDQAVFMININEVGEITIDSDRVSEVFTLTGNGDTLEVTTSGGIKPEVTNFKQFYKTLLTCYIQGYSELTDEQIAEVTAGDPELVFTYTTRSGLKTTYEFYSMSDRKTICMINGEGGEFHYLYTHINKISSDCIKVLNGEPVDSEDRS